MPGAELSSGPASAVSGRGTLSVKMGECRCTSQPREAGEPRGVSVLAAWTSRPELHSCTEHSGCGLLPVPGPSALGWHRETSLFCQAFLHLAEWRGTWAQLGSPLRTPPWSRHVTRAAAAAGRVEGHLCPASPGAPASTRRQASPRGQCRPGWRGQVCRRCGSGPPRPHLCLSPSPFSHHLRPSSVLGRFLPCLPGEHACLLSCIWSLPLHRAPGAQGCPSLFPHCAHSLLLR